jgi:FKBP-type peptidyl-prolyl cis-trans isomerase
VSKSVVVLGSIIVLSAGAALVAQTPAAPEKTPDTTSAPAEATWYEAPDGTKMPVVKTSEYCLKIQIEDLKLGDGEEAKPGATVTILYHGTLKDGKVFDSTRDRNNQTITYALGQLIEGWQLGIPGMKVGGIRRLTIPYQLAYGRGGRPGIPPNSDLIFSIELKGVKNP